MLPTAHSRERSLLDPYPARSVEVLVFKTSVQHTAEVEMLRHALDQVLNGSDQWNFDLEDHDRILRVESGTDARERIMELLAGLGFACDELE